MKLIIPYVDLHDSTAQVGWAYNALFRDTSWSDRAYYWTLYDAWLDGESFIVLEQDKIPGEGALEEIWTCPEPWCAYPVPMRHTDEVFQEYPSLSCTKFSVEMITDLPDLFERVGSLNMGFGLKHWDRLDLAIWGAADRPIHWHEAGHVKHFHKSGD